MGRVPVERERERARTPVARTRVLESRAQVEEEELIARVGLFSSRRSLGGNNLG